MVNFTPSSTFAPASPLSDRAGRSRGAEQRARTRRTARGRRHRIRRRRRGPVPTRVGRGHLERVRRAVRETGHDRRRSRAASRSPSSRVCATAPTNGVTVYDVIGLPPSTGATQLTVADASPADAATPVGASGSGRRRARRRERDVDPVVRGVVRLVRERAGPVREHAVSTGRGTRRRVQRRVVERGGRTPCPSPE